MSRNRSNRQYPQSPKKTSSRKEKRQYVVETPQQEPIIKLEPNIRKKFSRHDMKYVKPLTENQLLVFQEWGQGQHLVLEGYAGTGKSFIALYLALQTILDPETEQDKIVIIRSSVPTREIGFIKGDEAEKNSVYEMPYRQVCDKLFSWKNTYENLKEIGLIEFHNTSFLRGCSFDNAVIIFDEFQSATDHEETTVASRVGEESRLIICGDNLQNDIGGKSGGHEFLRILKRMEEVSFINFGLDDIVRSGFVKSFLMAKYR